MRLLIFIFGLISAQHVMASTFVGNGGNAGDIEMQITMGQAQKSLAFIDGNKDNYTADLCTCSSQFEGRPVCDILKKLNQEQTRFCARFVSMKAGDLYRLLSEKGNLSVSWTHDQIEVQEEGRLRGADAVTDPKKMTMTLNQKRFLDLDENERLFLFSHELFHLTTYQGKTLSDEGEIGPFKGPDGGRQFINAMAATVVMQANDYGVLREYAAAQKRSKSYKKTYVSVGYAAMTTPNDTTTAFDVNKTTGAQFGVRYQLTPEFGVLGQMSLLRGEKVVMSTINAKEERNVLGLGASYRFFPFANPLTSWGQSHLVLSATVDLLSGTYKYDEQGVGGSAKTSSTGFTVGCNYFIPFDSGLWAYAGASYSTLNYTYNLDNQVDLKYKDNGTTFALGVTYGF
ncbi:MAG: hypothetical protein JSU04_12655 [Bdellovibrionales bacterium]|nr:hypothetical protein [Bdellovibrionales bacterium]